MSSRQIRAQSAMEYLMTYGWAILIIAVVLGALFELGIFNTTGPRASPGSCEIYRPYGPGTGAGVSLAGQCNGELPQSVASFDNPLYANQLGSDILVPDLSYYISPLTITGWVYIPTLSYGSYLLARTGCCSITDLRVNGLGQVSMHVAAYSGGVSLTETPDSVSAGRWTFIAGTYDGTTLTLYVNGASVATTTGTVTSYGDSATNEWKIGYSYTGTEAFNGSIANVQIYNTSLSASEILGLYQEGIGGAPVRPQNILGWWPLNGNANDYSGNNYNGQTNKVVFTGSWGNGYTSP